MGQWCERSPPLDVARVRFLPGAICSYMLVECVAGSRLAPRVFLGSRWSTSTLGTAARRESTSSPDSFPLDRFARSSPLARLSQRCSTRIEDPRETQLKLMWPPL